MMHKTLLCLASIFACCFIFAQEKKQATKPYKFEKITVADFDLPKSPVVDENANAVVMADAGAIDFIGNKNNWA